MASRQRGVGWDEIIATLRHSANLSEIHQSLDLQIAADAARAGAATF